MMQQGPKQPHKGPGRGGGAKRLVPLALGGALIVLWYAFFGCPIRYFTGVSCPGCGVTRAWMCAVQLHFTCAFYYHPLFFLAPPLVAVLFLNKGPLGNKRVKNTLLILFGAAFLAVYLLRLFVFKGDVVGVQMPPPVWRDITRFISLSGVVCF